MQNIGDELLLEQFQTVSAEIPYQEKGIFPSEMFLFFALAKRLDCQHILESGGRMGGSTSYLSRLFDKVDSVCEKTTEKLPNVKRHYGDGCKILPSLVRDSDSQNIAVLVDGPKGQLAFDLALKLIENEKVKFVAVHDLNEEHQEDRLSSQREDFRRVFGFLDESVGEYLLKYPNGPGLTVFTNEPL